MLKKIIIFYIMILALPCWAGPHKAVSEKDKIGQLANPDLSFDGLSLAIPLMPEESPSESCDFLSYDFTRYKTLEVENRKNFNSYFSGLQKIISGWYEILKIYENKEVAFAANTFQPILEMVKNIEEVKEVLEANSVSVDNFLYNYGDIILSCTDSQSTLDLIENYSQNLFETESKFWSYLLDTAKLLNKIYAKYSKFEAAKMQPIELDFFSEL
ncbi:MAG: hypothetical protein KDD40_11810, partial [Bdellovibrionales bacterium]|nr:hypothetical protein [Bdellovibrionales bacterium]